MGPDGEDPLFRFLQEKLRVWRANLASYRSLASAAAYPGGPAVDEALPVIEKLLGETDSRSFVERFNSQQDGLMAIADAYHDLTQFHTHQRPAWDRLKDAFARFQINRMDLDRDDNALTALARMVEILKTPSPYGLIKEVDPLIQRIDAVYAALLARQREKATTTIDDLADRLKGELEKAGEGSPLGATLIEPLHNLKRQVEQQASVPHIAQAVHEAERAYDAAIERLAQRQNRQEKQDSGEGHATVEPAYRAIEKVYPARLTKGPLENEDEVRVFLEALRIALETALAENKRVEIR